jgi:aarF domain-containing kinase
MLAAPLAILAPLSYLSPKLEDIAWSYATWSVETAGPTFTKLAQWASTRADLFPAEFVGRFSKLQDATEGHAWEHTDTILRQSLGDNYNEIIDLDPKAKPIGSGCIAQVYKATLKQPTSLFPSGTELAIKVQHPRIRDKVLVDFYILHKFASILEHIPYLNLDYLSIQDSVLQFRQIMVPQLDMTNEARNLTRFLRDFSNDDSITFPQPLHELTSEHVLVEKFMHGNDRFIPLL